MKFRRKIKEMLRKFSEYLTRFSKPLRKVRINFIENEWNFVLKNL